MITKEPRDVIHEAHALEEYLDRFLWSEHLTFEQWVQRFGQGFYSDRNTVMLALATPFQPRNILEFACAGPFLARLLVDSIGSIEKYTCSNFSRRMVEYCAAQLSDNPHCEVAFIDADVRRSEDMHRTRLSGYDMFITTSLEHIQFDREVIRQLPIGAAFIFSVAYFDDPEHFRVYENADEIRSRYGDLLRIIEARENTDGNKLAVAAIRQAPDSAA